jgi:transposase
METTSLDLRKRILACCDTGKGTRASVAKRFYVSLGLVKKLIQQQRHLGDIAPLHWRAGRTPLFTSAHKEQMAAAIRRQPDTALAEFRELLGLDCSLPSIHRVLIRMGMTYKKRRFGRANRTVQTSRRRGRTGSRR